MDNQKMYECGICYFQGIVRDFAPIIVSANFAALVCPKCLNNDAESLRSLRFRKNRQHNEGKASSAIERQAD